MDILVKDAFESSTIYLENKDKIEELIIKSLKLIDVSEETPFFMYYYWSKKKEIIRSLFNVDWKSPDEINPDFAFLNNTNEQDSEELLSYEAFADICVNLLPGLFTKEEILNKLAFTLEGGIVFAPMNNHIGGYYSSKAKQITINSNISENRLKLTVFHEMLHALSYNMNKGKCGFRSIKDRANMFDEGVISFVEQSYARRNLQIKNNSRQPLNGYFFVSLIEQLYLVVGNDLITYFFKDQENYLNLLSGYHYNNISLNSMQEPLDVNTFKARKETLSKFKIDEREGTFLNLFDCVQNIKENMTKNPEDVALSIYTAESIVSSELLYRVLDNQNISLSEISRLLSMQNNPNYDTFYQMIKHLIKDDISLLNNYPLLQEVVSLIENVYYHPTIQLSGPLIDNRCIPRFITRKMANLFDPAEDYNIANERYYYLEAASKAYTNGYLTISDLLSNMKIGRIELDRKEDPHKDFYIMLKDLISRDLPPIYHIRTSIKECFSYDGNIYKPVFVSYLIKQIQEERKEALGFSSKEDADYYLNELNEVEAKLLSLGLPMVFVSEDTYDSFLYLENDLVNVFDVTQTNKVTSYPLSAFHNIDVDFNIPKM